MSDPINPINAYTLDDYFQSTPVGSVDRAIGNNLYGINHRQVAGMVPINKDLYGLTFFVRPQLNLHSNNVRNLRLLYPLLNKNTNSIQRFTRCTLDPRLMYDSGDGSEGSSGMNCILVDPLQAFIPVLTNNLNSISGWPDITAPTFSSKAGLYQEVYSQVDGVVKNFSEFEMDATFRNTRGDAILYLFYIWLHYQANVFEGVLVPYIDFLSQNRLDYNTRIYRLVLDPSRTYVTKIAATGVSFPISAPTGQFFDFTAERPYNDQSKEITIRFKCLGAQYQDEILIKEFNDTVVMFNPAMGAAQRNDELCKIDEGLLPYFNNRGYPRINPDTHEMEWWIDNDVFQRRTYKLLANGLVDKKYEDLLSTGD